MKKILIFDNDGVLRDESVSYSRCVAETVAFFSNEEKATEKELIESMKISNDDWDRTHKILESRGKKVKFEDVKNHFQNLYLGKKRDFTGYINNEPWLVENKKLEDLSNKYELAIVSGAPREEIVYTLKRNKAFSYFKIILGMDDCAGKKDGVEKVMAELKAEEAFFCDDRPSPIKSVLGVNKKVNIYGILPPNSVADWKKVLLDAGAKSVFNNVNEYLDFLIVKLNN